MITNPTNDNQRQTKKRKLNLQRPICFFDLETTGINISKDRIIEIGILKVFPNGTEESKEWLINPEIIMSEEVIAIHGITNEMLADEKPFFQVGHEIYDMIRGTDLGGFNSNRFDIPFLIEEFIRAGIDIDIKDMKSVDVQIIFHKMEKRTLVAAYKFYCEKDLDGAHRALADTEATYDVLLSQIDRYSMDNDIEKLAEFSCYKKTADFSGYIGYDEDGDEILTFGKHKGKKISFLLKYHEDYLDWFLNADFPNYTKNILEEIVYKYLIADNV